MRPLRSYREVIEHGRRSHICLAYDETWALRAARGETFLYSIRVGDESATAALSWDAGADEWCVEELKGAGNSDASFNLIAWLVRHCQFYVGRDLLQRLAPLEAVPF